jgi:glycosyltransferase involved in cell wall biosynthesis
MDTAINSQRSLSVIIPALNEEKKILQTVETVYLSLRQNNILDYEIIIFDDGSLDKTGEIAENASLQDQRIRVVHHQTPQGMGKSYQEGVSLSRKEYVLTVPGDNELRQESVAQIMSALGKSDVVVVYTSNQEVRQFSRRVFSKTYTFINNSLFGLDLPYFNGACLIKRELLANLKINDTRFVFMTEILVKLIKRDKCDYITVPMEIKPVERGSSKAFKLKNFVGVGKGILNLYKEIYFK